MFLTFNRTFNIVEFDNESTIIYPLLSLFIVVLAYFGIKQTTIFSNLKTHASYVNIEAEKVTKKNSAHKYEQFEEIYKRIEELMKKEKLYLQPELSIDKLSVLLGVNANYLSKSINSIGGNTFYNYVNHIEFRNLRRKSRIKLINILRLYILHMIVVLIQKQLLTEYLKKRLVKLLRNIEIN